VKSKKMHQPNQDGAAQSPKAKAGDRIVNEEHVLCANCYYQFSFLYEGKKDVPPDRPHQLLHAPIEEVVKKRLERYRKPEESFHACVNCGYVQPWMVRIARRLRVRTAVSIALGSLCLDYLVYTYLTNFAGVVEAGPAWALALAGLIVLATSIALYHSLRIWDPNEGVDQQSYGGAARVAELESPPEWDPKLALSMIPHPGKYRPWLRLLVRWLAGLSLAGGCVVFALPLLSEGIAYHLERSNVVMVPFWLGIGLMAFGSAMAVAAGLQGKYHRRRHSPALVRSKVAEATTKGT
jgi:hypothetical protein